MKTFGRGLKPYTGNCNISRRAKYEWRKRVMSGAVRPENVPGAHDDLSGIIGAGSSCIGMIGIWLAILGLFAGWVWSFPGIAIMAWAFYRLRTMK